MSARVGKGLAAAIVLAGALIGMGLYFGLRSRDRLANPAASSARTSFPQPAQLSTERFAAALLEYHRPELVKRCWPGQGVGARSPGPATMRIDVTFGPDGTQVARGFLEDRGASQPELTACIQRALPPLRVPPPGVSVRVELPLTLP